MIGARRNLTIDLSRATKRSLDVLADDAAEYPSDTQRPVTRADCLSGGNNGVRPCPFVACRHHLFLDVKGSSITFNFPDKEPDELERTCSLDVADDGTKTLDDLGQILNLTRERIRQIETSALSHLPEDFWIAEIER